VTSTETWPWRRMNEGNAAAHALLASLLEPRPGERWLDVGTGGGGLALELARSGADVVGVDVASDGLEHARSAAAAERLTATFALADACALPYEDASFDGVASAFGVVFAREPEAAAAELARVCRGGGRLGLTLMPAATRTGALWDVLLRHGHPGPHPAVWEADLERLLGGDFVLEAERRETSPHGSHALEWERWVESFGPLRDLVTGLDESAVAAVRADVEEVDGRFAGAPQSYVVVLGRRR
jgi:SAM-dependent methyltransferase